MPRLLLSILLLLPYFPASALDVYVPHWMAGMGAGGNSDGYEAELFVTYYVVPGFGFRLAVGASGEIEEVGDWDWINGDDYYDEYDYATRFKFMPSIEMRSPAFIKWGDANDFRLFANPGLCLSPGAGGSRNPDWFYWQLRGGFEMNFSEFTLQLGYGYSNFDLYSGDPYSHNYKREDPGRRTHSVFLNFGMKF